MKGRVVYNIGGIANPTVIPAGAEIEGVFAFDSGPGNMIIDGLVFLMTDGRKTYDADGAIAATGTVNRDRIEELIARSFIRQAPPEGAAREVLAEVLAIVVLANDTVQGQPGNAPAATGAARRVLVGDITPGRAG